MNTERVLSWVFVGVIFVIVIYAIYASYVFFVSYTRRLPNRFKAGIESRVGFFAAASPSFRRSSLEGKPLGLGA